MSDSTRVEFSARDGVTLRGDFYKAAGDKAPIAVMAAGFGLPKETSAGFASMLRGAGISVLAYDYRSFGSSDGTPRQEIDLYEQADDFSDAVTAARSLPGVDPAKVIMWGIGHGTSVAMIAAGNDPRLKAVILHIPFPSGRIDAAGFPPGLLDRAWQELESKTRAGDASPSYAKVWRDWAEDKDGDESTVFIKGPAAYHFQASTKAGVAAAGTPWENQVTLRSFLNVAGTETGDFAYKIKYPTAYVVNANDPFAPSTEVQRKFFGTMGPNAEFKEIPIPASGNLGEQLGQGTAFLIDWVKAKI